MPVPPQKADPLKPAEPAPPASAQPRSLGDKISAALGLVMLAYFAVAIVVGLIAFVVTNDWGAWLDSWGDWFGRSGDHGSPYDGPYDSGYDCPAGPRSC